MNTVWLGTPRLAPVRRSVPLVVDSVVAPHELWPPFGALGAATLGTASVVH